MTDQKPSPHEPVIELVISDNIDVESDRITRCVAAIQAEYPGIPVKVYDQYPAFRIEAAEATGPVEEMVATLTKRAWWEGRHMHDSRVSDGMRSALLSAFAALTARCQQAEAAADLAERQTRAVVEDLGKVIEQKSARISQLESDREEAKTQLEASLTGLVQGALGARSWEKLPSLGTVPLPDGSAAEVREFYGAAVVGLAVSDAWRHKVASLESDLSRSRATLEASAVVIADLRQQLEAARDRINIQALDAADLTEERDSAREELGNVAAGPWSEPGEVPTKPGDYLVEAFLPGTPTVFFAADRWTGTHWVEHVVRRFARITPPKEQL